MTARTPNQTSPSDSRTADRPDRTAGRADRQDDTGTAVSPGAAGNPETVDNADGSPDRNRNSTHRSDQVQDGSPQAGADDRAAARRDWENRIGRRSAAAGAGVDHDRQEQDGRTPGGTSVQPAGAVPGPLLEAPTGLTAVTGAGHVTLSWEPVVGAGGYLIRRSGPDARPAPGGRSDPRSRLRLDWSDHPQPTDHQHPEAADHPEPADQQSGQEPVGSGWLDHGGSDVAVVPSTCYADTLVEPSSTYTYQVASTTAPDAPPSPASDPVQVTTWASGWHAPVAGPRPPVVDVKVDTATVVSQLDRIWRMVGSERLAQFRHGDNGHGNVIGDEFAAALSQARRELRVSFVRSHGIFHDELGTYRRGPGGQAVYDFDGVDSVLDTLLSTGVRPVVELSFMPAALARDPHATVFEWKGIVSPPTDWGHWAELNRRLVAHLVDRYGLETVRTWAFEVWNEPNLEVFWTGTQEEYFRLYAEAATAVKSVDPKLRVGGPATAASEWLEPFVAFVVRNELPLDFLSTHTYGNLPMHVRPILERHGLERLPIWWTEWGVGSTHFGPIHDSAFGAAFVLRGLKAAQGHLAALAYWVVSDHFEELGRPPRLFHNGFGLLSVGNLRKPRYWAVQLAEGLSDDVLSCRVEGDGASSLVDAWATRSTLGRIDVVVWNVTPNGSQFRGVRHLARKVRLAVSPLTASRYSVFLTRIDNVHSNICRHLPEQVDWPTAEQWEQLRAADALHEERLEDLVATPQGTATLSTGGDRTAGGDVAAGGDVVAGGDMAWLEADLPMPGILRWRLVPR